MAKFLEGFTANPKANKRKKKEPFKTQKASTVRASKAKQTNKNVITSQYRVGNLAKSTGSSSALNKSTSASRGYLQRSLAEQKKKQQARAKVANEANKQYGTQNNKGGSTYAVNNSTVSAMADRRAEARKEKAKDSAAKRYAELTARYNPNERKKSGNSFMTAGAQTGVEKKNSRVADLTAGTAKQIVGGHLTAVGDDTNEYNEFKKFLDDALKKGKINQKTYDANLEAFKRSSTKYDKYKDWEVSKQHKVYQDIKKKGMELNDKGNRQVEKGMEGLGTFGRMAAGAYTSGLGMASDMALGPAWAVSMMNRTQGNSLAELDGLVKQGIVTEREADNYAGLQGLKEAGTEYFFQGAGLAKGLKGVGTITKGFSKATDTALDVLTSRIRNNALKNLTSSGLKLAKGGMEEAAEELIGGVLDAPITNAAYANRLYNERQSEIQGAASSIISNVDGLVAQGLSRADATQLMLGELNSEDFADNLTQSYIEGGLGEKAAKKQAEAMQEYYSSMLSGDDETAAKLEKQLLDGIKAKFSLSDTLEAMGSAGLMTAVTGLPGAVNSNATGGQIKRQLGHIHGTENTAKAITSITSVLDDEKMQAKAQALSEEAAKGHELSNEQYYELYSAMQQQMENNSLSARTVQSAAENMARSERYMYSPVIGEDAEGNLVFNNGADSTVNDKIRAVRENVQAIAEGNTELSEEDKRGVREAIVAIEAGYPTAYTVEYFTTNNPIHRTIYEEVTGESLPMGNKETRDYLFKRATENRVETARLETIDTIDRSKGRLDSEMSLNMGGAGQRVLSSVTEKVGLSDTGNYVRYASLLGKVYDAGRTGVPFNTAMKLADSLGITEGDSIKRMYEAGIQDAENGFTESTVIFKNSSAVKASDRDFALAFARAFGVNIVFREGLTTNDAAEAEGKEIVEEGHATNGFYVPSTNTIYIDPKRGIQGSVGNTIMHELVHHIKNRMGAEYAEFAKLFEDSLVDKLGKEKAERIIQDKIDLYERNGEKLDREEAIEELICDQMGEVLHDEEFIANLAKEHPSVARAILNALRDVIQRIRNMFAEYGGFKTAYNEATLSQLDMLKDAERLLVKTMQKVASERAAETVNELNAVEGRVANDEVGTIKWALIDKRNKNISANDKIPYVVNNNYIPVPKGDYASLTTLQNAVRGLKRGTYENKATGYMADINGNTIGKILNPGKGFNAFSDRYINNLNAATHLPSLFENAVYIDTKAPQKSKNVGKQIQGYHHFVAPLRMDGQEFRVRIVAREKQNSDTLYIVDAEVIKKGGSSVGRSKASQFVSIPSDVSISDLVNGVKIFDYSSQKNDNYNVQDIRFSISETDSSGNTLSDGQREYFNDSKVVDENGNLRVVYHGTQNAGFTVFKRTNTFYTSSREVANSYTDKGGVYEGYLNITNPLEIDCNNERWSRIETDQIDSAVTDLFKEYGASTFEEDDAERTSTADIISVVENAIEDEALDYDGVIFKNIYDEGMFGNHETGTLLSDVYVTFNSNQFKNRDNLEPTDNPDIRFSMSSPVEESKDLIAVHNLNADNIRRLADLGGLPMPSIAIIKAAQGHNVYGDYSFVFDKTTIDPKRNKANKVYGGDAWTPTFPRNSKSESDVLKKLKEYYYTKAATEEDAAAVWKLAQDTAKLPTGYFEAKPERAVTFDEVKAVIAPNDAPRDILDIFEKAGLEVHEYAAGDDVDRTRALNEVSEEKKVRFSIEPGMTDTERYLNLKDKALKVVVPEESSLPELTEEERQELLSSNWTGAKKAAIALIKALGVKGVYSTDDIDFDFEFTDRGINESAQKQGAVGPEDRFINQVKLMSTLRGVIENAHLLKVSTDEEYVKENPGHRPHPNLKYSYVLVSAFEDKGQIIPVKFTVFEFNRTSGPKLHVALTVETIKKSEVTVASLNESESAATPTFVEVSLSDLLPKINDEALKKYTPKEFYPTELEKVVDKSVKSSARKSFPTEDELIQSSLDEGTYYDPLLGDYITPESEAKHVKALEELKAYIENISLDPTKLTHGKVLDVKSVSGEIKKMLSTLTDNSDNTAAQNKELNTIAVNAAQKIWGMFGGAEGFMKAPDAQVEEARDFMLDIAHEIVSSINFVDAEMLRDYKDMREYFKAVPLIVPNNVKSDIDYSDFRKKYFGKLRLVSESYAARTGEGQYIDAIWDEVASVIAPFGTSAENENSIYDVQDVAEMFELVGRALDSQGAYTDLYTNEIAQDLEMQLAKDLVQTTLTNGAPWQSFADEKKAQYDLRAKQLKERHKEAIRDLRAIYNERLARERQKGKDKLAEEKARQKERKEEAKRKTKHKKHWNKILGNYNWLQQRLLKPTKDEGKHIPEELRAPLASLLAEFDLQTQRSIKLEEKKGPSKATVSLRSLKDAIQKISDEEGQAEYIRSPRLLQDMDDLIAKLDKRALRDLTDEEIGLVDDMLSQIRHMIAHENKLFGEAKKATVIETGEQIIKDSDAKVERYGRTYSYAGAKGTIRHILNEDMMTPPDFFDGIGGSLDGMYKSLRLAQDEYIRKFKYTQEFIEKTFEKFRNTKKPGGTVEEWSTDKSFEEFVLESGQRVKLTVAQRMSLYCLSKREQALKHILGSGIVISDVSPAKGLSKLLGRKKENTVSAVALTYGDVMNINKSLSEDQVAVAMSLQGFMSSTLSDWGNKTSMELYGINLFKEKNYFPIVSEAAYLDGKIGEGNDIKGNKILSFGFTKAPIDSASNPIIVDNIFTLFASHANKMALYSSYSAELVNFNRVLNYKRRTETGLVSRSVRESLQDAYGDRIIPYIENLLNDVNGQAASRNDGISRVINASLARYKKAAIGLNARVLVQQPTAIVRALQYVSPKYFTPDTFIGLGKAKTEMHEHCPITFWKANGNFQNDYTRSLEDQMFNRWTRTEVITMHPYGWADDVTWAVIWKAVKKKVESENPTLQEGTEEFWAKCNEEASIVYDRTQVVDSVFHRSDAMRSNKEFTKLATSFMSEPTKTYNMLRSSIVKARRYAKDGEKGKAVAELVKVGNVLIANAATVSAAAAVIDALRGKKVGDDDDDETFFEMWLGNFFANFLDNGLPTNQIVWVKDISQLIVNAWQGNSFGTSNMALEGWDKLAKGIAQIQNLCSGDIGFLEWISGDLGAGLGYVTGLPTYNFLREGKALWKVLNLPTFASDEITEAAAAEKVSLFDYEKNPLSIQDGTWGDNVLNFFGVNLTKKERQERDYKSQLKNIKKKTKGLSSEDKAEQVNKIVMDGYTTKTDEADTASLKRMRQLIKDAGGDVDEFDEKVNSKLATAYKKTIGKGKGKKQARIREYLLNSGYTEEQISREIVYKSEGAKAYKEAACAMDHDAMVLALIPLVQAGLTEQDAYRLFENRNKGTRNTGSTGSLLFPCEGEITSGFGYRDAPTAGASSYHQGIDIGAALGSYVRSADGGKVVFAGANGGYGYQVIVQHDNGTKTYYSHLDYYAVKKGQKVSQNQWIGNVGSTGTSTGPHLDFRVEVNGSFVNPMDCLS